MRKIWPFAGLTVALLVAAISACASSNVALTAQAKLPVEIDGYLSVTEQVAPGVHMMRQAVPNFAGVVGNVSIIEQDDSVILVDSGASHGSGARVVESVRRLTAKPVSAVIITHWHNDHPLGVSAIVEAWPEASIIATEATLENLRAGRTNTPLEKDADFDAKRQETLKGYIDQFAPGATDENLSQSEREGWARVLSAQRIRIADQPGTHVMLPNRTFRDALTLDDRRRPIEVRFLGRANTDGDAIVWLPRQRMLITGDIVVAPVPYMFSVFPSENIATLEKLRAYNFAALIPGHGETQRDKAYLDLLIAFMREVRAQIAPLAQQGLSVEDITAQVTLDDYAQKFAGDDPWLRQWYRDYAVAPLIESAYREAKGERLGPP